MTIDEIRKLSLIYASGRRPNKSDDAGAKTTPTYQKPWTWAEYYAYLNSPEWRALSARIIAERGRKCQSCATTTARVYQVHHKTYVRLGHELDQDLWVTCFTCHKRHHFKAKPLKA